MIPKPYYSLIETSIGDDPAVVVVNTALRTFKEREAFPWHLKICVDCKLLAERGMPTPDEVGILEGIEDAFAGLLLENENAIFLARITARGLRKLLYRVHDPEVADETLQMFISRPEQVREWEFRMEEDADWSLAQRTLRLLERAPDFN